VQLRLKSNNILSGG